MTDPMKDIKKSTKNDVNPGQWVQDVLPGVDWPEPIQPSAVTEPVQPSTVTWPVVVPGNMMWVPGLKPGTMTNSAPVTYNF